MKASADRDRIKFSNSHNISNNTNTTINSGYSYGSNAKQIEDLKNEIEKLRNEKKDDIERIKQEFEWQNSENNQIINQLMTKLSGFESNISNDGNKNDGPRVETFDLTFGSSGGANLLASFGGKSGGGGGDTNRNQNNNINNNTNIDEQRYLRDIAYLEETLKLLKAEKYELYEEKTTEIRDLKLQVANLKTTLEKTERTSLVSSENEEKSKKIFELQLLVNNKELEIENLKKLIQYERNNCSLKEDNHKYEIKNLQAKIKVEEESLRNSISKLTEQSMQQEDQFIQNILFENENLKYELEKANQQIKFLENNKKNDDDFFNQVRIVYLND